MDERWIREDGLATLPTKTANDFLRFVPLVFFFSLRGSLRPTLRSCIDAPDACQGDVVGNKHADLKYILRRCIRQYDDICHVRVLNIKMDVYI